MTETFRIDLVSGTMLKRIWSAARLRRRRFGLPKQDREYALVIDPTGKVMARQEGPYEADKRKPILDAMRN